MSENKKAKEEKPIIRKCHNCGKVLDDDKDFCLHCGETYRVVEKVKKPVNKKLIIKLSIIFVVVALLAVAVAFVVKLIRDDMNESRFVRTVNYILENGSREEYEVEQRFETPDVIVSDEEESSSIENTSATSSDEDEEEEEEETTEDAVKYIYVIDIDDRTQLYCFEDATDTFHLKRESTTYEHNYKGEVSGQLYIELDICMSEQAPHNYTWGAFLEYDSMEGYQGYDFSRSYTGTLDPEHFTYRIGDLVPSKLSDDKFVNAFENASAMYQDLEGILLDMKLEDIISAMNASCYELDNKTSEIIPLLKKAMDDLQAILDNEELVDPQLIKMEADLALLHFNEDYYKLFPDKMPAEDEGAEEQSLSLDSIIVLMARESTDDEEEESEPKPIIIPPTEAILQAAVGALSEQARFSVEALQGYLDENAKKFRVTIGEIGFVDYQNYIDSLVTVKK